MSLCLICRKLTYVACHAVPTSGDVTGIAARDEAAPVPGLYGDGGRPEIDDLVKRTSACMS